MNLSLHTHLHAPLRISPDLIWRWTLVTISVLVFALLCYLLALIVNTPSYTDLAAVIACFGSATG